MGIKFSEFLIEDHKKKNNALIVLQKIIDMVDDGHVDYDSKKITINVGKLIKDKRFYDLSIILRKGEGHSVRLAQDTTDEKYVIVIDTTRLPAREKIDSFLSKRSTVDKFIPEFQKYLDTYHKDDEDAEAVTSYERGKEANSRSTFEKKYKELNKVIKDKLEEYNSAKTEIERDIDETGTPGRKEILKISLDGLKNEYLGKNAKEFVSKMMKLADDKFVEVLDKELKDKLVKRLTDFYEHQVA